MDIVTYGALNKKVGEKLSSNQGTQNAGKMLGINNEGEIQPIQVLGGNVSVTETLESGEDYSMVIEEGEPTAVTSVAGKYGTVTLDAGDIEYDEQEVYNSGTVGKEVGDLKSQIGPYIETEYDSMCVVRDAVNGSVLSIEPGQGATSIFHTKKNLFNLFDRTKGYQAGSAATKPRNFEIDKYYNGFVSNGIYNGDTYGAITYIDGGIQVSAGSSGGGGGKGTMFPVLLPSGTYTLSGLIRGYVRIMFYDKSNVFIDYSDAIGTPGTEINASLQFTVTNEHGWIGVFFQNLSATSENNPSTFKNIQIELASTASEYEAYDGEVLPATTKNIDLYDGTNYIWADGLFSVKVLLFKQEIAVLQSELFMTQSNITDLQNYTITEVNGSNFLCPSAIYAPNGESLYGANRALSTPPDNAVCIKLASDIQVALFGHKHLDYLGCWNGVNGFVTTTTWMSGVIDLKAIYSLFPDCNFKLVFRYTNNQNIENVTDIENKVSFVLAGTYEKENGFYTHPSSRQTSALTIINKRLYSFKFTTSNDNEPLDYSVYPLSRGFITRMKNNATGTSNFGHNNCVDYSHKNGYLLASNGGSSANTNPSQIYLFANAKSIAESLSDFDVNSANCITIDLSQDGHFGKQVNAVWGESNFGKYDLIFVMSNYEAGSMTAFDENNVCDYTGNSIRFLHVVQLGKGTNQLDSGAYTAKPDDEFNGTYKVVGSYTYDFVSAESVNDAQYYHGSLYINTTSSKPKIVVLSIKNNTIEKRTIDMVATNATGATISSEGEGLAISDDGYVYFTYYGFNVCSIDNFE